MDQNNDSVQIPFDSCKLTERAIRVTFRIGVFKPYVHEGDRCYSLLCGLEKLLPQLQAASRSNRAIEGAILDMKRRLIQATEQFEQDPIVVMIRQDLRESGSLWTIILVLTDHDGMGQEFAQLARVFERLRDRIAAEEETHRKLGVTCTRLLALVCCLVELLRRVLRDPLYAHYFMRSSYDMLAGGEEEVYKRLDSKLLPQTPSTYPFPSIDMLDENIAKLKLFIKGAHSKLTAIETKNGWNRISPGVVVGTSTFPEDGNILARLLITDMQEKTTWQMLRVNGSQLRKDCMAAQQAPDVWRIGRSGLAFRYSHSRLSIKRCPSGKAFTIAEDGSLLTEDFDTLGTVGTYGTADL
jgi:hypothetical protein